jgi:sugar/nucleoside kinase (ribokinase family)
MTMKRCRPLVSREREMPEVLVCGEVLAEIMRKRVGARLDVTDDFVGPFASGAPAIFADQVARLGHNVALFGTVGSDAFGSFIRARLQADGVDVRGLDVSPDLATGVAFVTYFEDGSRQFLFHLGTAAAGRLPPVAPEILAGAPWMHICGSSLAGSSAMRDAIYAYAEAAADHGCRISYDPNLRPELLRGGLDEFRALSEPIVDRAHVVLPGREELEALTGERDVEPGAHALLGRGVKLVAVKLGAEGALFVSPDETHRAPAFPVRAVDPTGAGDCFDAGVVAGLAEDLPLEEVAVLANACGALGASAMGPMEGAMFRSDVDTFIRASHAAR